MSFTAQEIGREAEIAVSLPVKVQAHLPDDEIFREISRVENVTRTSAEFHLTRQVEIGQLLWLKMPVKKDLRLFDFDKEKYSVWGIVRECRQLVDYETRAYRVKVALIGQEPPPSFRRNPLTTYKLGKLGDDGFWQISEEKQGPENRRQPRYAIPVEVVIIVCDANENVVTQEKTVTENISRNGASVFSSLPLNVGDTVKFVKQYGSFSAQAVVRHRRVGADNLPRLHLEFVNGTFPLSGID